MNMLHKDHMYVVQGYMTYICPIKFNNITDEVLVCEPMNRDETPGGPEESGWTKSRHMYLIVYVYKVHMCIYMLGGGMRSWTFPLTFFFFQKRKAKDVNANHR